ncbi:MAG: ATP-binding protein, partial [Treponema sp.]|nr:ATP-binding protein [Treponema sp.]
MFLDFLLLKRIKVFALVGESGTGKSFRAKLVAQKYNIDFIIDDGLLIRDNRILAGHSAKKEKTFLAAVKVALFDEKSHRDEVARRLQSEKIKRILVLGTSEKMVNKIAARL